MSVAHGVGGVSFRRAVPEAFEFTNFSVHTEPGYLKAVWPEIIGPVFGQFSAKLGPKTPLERRGSSCSAGCTKNQPRRPILRPFRGNSEFGNHPLQ